MTISPKQHLGAALIACTWVALFILSTPICDTTVSSNYATPEQRAAYRAEVGWPLSEVVLGAVWINTHGRGALHDKLAPLQRPFQLRQYWNLYPMKGESWRSMEVVVDGEVVFRTPGNVYGWRRMQLRNRRINLALNALSKNKSPVGPNLVRFVIAKARADFPDAKRVTLVWTHGPYPGDEARQRLTIRASAPRWKVRHSGYKP